MTPEATQDTGPASEVLDLDAYEQDWNRIIARAVEAEARAERAEATLVTLTAALRETRAMVQAGGVPPLAVYRRTDIIEYIDAALASLGEATPEGGEG